MGDDRRCLHCGGSLENRRSDTLFCSPRHKKRYYRQQAASGRSGNYIEPPPGNSLAQDRADREWRRQLAAEEVRAEPATEEELQALALQKRNPGPLVPFFRQRRAEQDAAELAAREAAVRDSRALRPESPYDRTTIGSVRARGRASRALNKPQEPYREMHRAVPWAEEAEAEMSDVPEGWRRGRR